MSARDPDGQVQAVSPQTKLGFCNLRDPGLFACWQNAKDALGNCFTGSAEGRGPETPPPRAARRRLRGTQASFLPKPDAKTPPQFKQRRGPGELRVKGVYFSTHLQGFQILPSKIQLSLGGFFFFPSDFYYDAHQNSNPRSKSLLSDPLSITKTS